MTDVAAPGEQGADDELAALYARVHRGVTTLEYVGRAGSAPRTVPCILVRPDAFARIMRGVAGRPFSVVSHMDILQDGLGHVFVDLSLDFGRAVSERFLIDASASYGFFDLLAETAVLAVAPKGGSAAAGGPAGTGDVLLVQLPRPEKISESLGIIRNGLAVGGGAGGAAGRGGARE